MMNEITLDNMREYIYKIKPECDDENHSHCENDYVVFGKYSLPEGGSIDQIQILIVNVVCLGESFIVSLNDLNNKFIIRKPTKLKFKAGN